MSPRHFARVFVQETGTTPAKFVESLRREAARRYLEDSTRGQKEISHLCGFTSAEVMRRTRSRIRSVARPGDQAWFAESEGWRIEEYGLDFRVGGREHGRFRRGNGPETRNETVYLDIVPDRRIVMAYTMALDGKNISARSISA